MLLSSVSSSSDKTNRLPADLTNLQKPLEHFRATTRRGKIHPLELAALWAIGAHMVFLPWALGSTRSWAQIISFGFAIVGLAIALLPRTYTEEHTSADPFRLIMWPKLIKFPIFWIGLALLGYITLQGLNPAWTYQTNGKTWWMQRIEAKPWLPTGVTAPFEKWNQWRMLIIYASGLMTVCAIWVAFTRRRTVQLFLMTLAVNGLLIAILGVMQRVSNAPKIFWLVESPNRFFFGSFIYKNHGAAYLNLILIVTCGLASWYHIRGLRRLEKSNPSGVLAFFATFIAIAVLVSYARGATLTMLAFLLSCIGVFVARQFMIPRESRNPVIAVTLVLIFGVFLGTGLIALNSSEAWQRLKRGLDHSDGSLDARELATQASLEMLHEQLPRGVGAGSFRYIFPIYQYRHAALIKTDYGQQFWDYAHNDIVQFPIELGVIGIGLVLVAAGYWLTALVKAYFWENPLSASLLFGVILLVVYAWWDFPFQCPAILITWCALWTVATMWARFEESGAKG